MNYVRTSSIASPTVKLRPDFLLLDVYSQEAKEIQEPKPDIARIIKQDFFVDDLFTGSDSLRDAQRICCEVSDVLEGGCFEFRKWYSNSSEVLQDISHSNLARNTLEFSKDDKTRT
ncbi:hypothetical protein JTB14_021172 [Gonioctena quinquepunctata]|nr:hypothetical protein JTB14_021172 [Gonioctena quinquepunctata]